MPAVAGGDLHEKMNSTPRTWARSLCPAVLRASCHGSEIGVSYGSEMMMGKALILCDGIVQTAAFPGENDFIRPRRLLLRHMRRDALPEPRRRRRLPFADAGMRPISSSRSAAASRADDEKYHSDRDGPCHLGDGGRKKISPASAFYPAPDDCALGARDRS